MSELVRFLSGDNDVAQKTQMDPQNPTAKFVPLEPGQVLFIMTIKIRTELLLVLAWVMAVPVVQVAEAELLELLLLQMASMRVMKQPLRQTW